MAEYWLISAPGDKTPQQTYVNLKGRMTGLSPVFQLNLPELKVGNVILFVYDVIICIAIFNLPYIKLKNKYNALKVLSVHILK